VYGTDLLYAAGFGALANATLQHYFVQVSTSASFDNTTGVVRVPSQNSASSVTVLLGAEQLSFLAFGVHYFVRANASNGLATGNYSTVIDTGMLKETIKCPADAFRWMDYQGDEACYSCPQFANSPALSDGNSSCACNVGYSGLYAGPCSECVAGTYKFVNGSSACVACVQGTYSGATAQTSKTACVLCPSHTDSAEGSRLVTNCSCNAGYTGVDGADCIECIAGTWKAVNGSSSCILCPWGKYSTETGQFLESTCRNCPYNMYSSDGSGLLTNCSCNAGYTGDDGTDCIECIAGTWKAVNGSSSCMLCPSGKYSNETGQFLESACNDCPTHTYSGDGSSVITNCTCDFGFTGPGGTLCTACPVDTYKEVRGSAFCIACPFNSNSSVGSIAVADCKCRPGWTGPDGEACVECQAGKLKKLQGNATCQECGYATYSERTGMSACTACSQGTYRDANATACLSCPVGKRLQKHEDESLCVQDLVSIQGAMSVSVNLTTFEKYRSQYVVGIAAVAQVHPSFVEILSVTEAARRRFLRRLFNVQGASVNVDFRITASASYAHQISALVTQNALTTWASQNGVPAPALHSIEVTCGMGLAPSTPSSGCVPCTYGQFKYSIDNSSCLSCPANTFSNTTGGTFCVPCPGNSSSANGSKTCSCDPGASGPDGGPCAQCGPGTFKETNGAAACSTCPGNSSSSEASDEEVDCTCNAGWTGPAGGVCMQCTAGTYKIAPGDAACSNCVAGKYSTVAGSTSDGCEACPTNSDSPEASDEEVDCTCNAGWTGPVGDTCSQCAAGTFKADAGSAVCDACPANSDSPLESTASTNCTCRPGWTGSDGDSCTACVNGTYKISTGTGNCTNCPSGTESGAASSALIDCLCTPGYTWSMEVAQCVTCSSGKYKVGVGTGPCTDCPSATSSPAGSTELDACAFGCSDSQYSDPSIDLLDSSIVDYNFTVSAEFKPDTLGNAFLGSCSSPYDHCLGSQQVILASTVIFPSTPQDGMLWHFGGNTSLSWGAWLGVRDSATSPTLRVRAGEGRSISTGLKQIWVDVADFPKDGAEHQVVVQIGNPSGGKWALQLWIDGTHKGISGEMTSSEWTYRGISSTGSSSYGLQASNTVVATGEPILGWPDAPTSIKSNLRIFAKVPWQSCDTPVLAGDWAKLSRSSLRYSCCESCPSNSTPTGNRTGVSSCTCVRGYTGPNGQACAACPQGQYKEQTGPAACLLCVGGKYSDNTAASSRSTCLPCQANSTTQNNGSAACLCLKGYTGDAMFNCTICPRGTFKATLGSAPCSLCAADAFSSSQGVDRCSRCPEFSYSPASIASGAITDCSCLAGYEGPDGGTCTACYVGKFKETNGISFSRFFSLSRALSHPHCPPHTCLLAYDLHLHAGPVNVCAHATGNQAMNVHVQR